MLGLHFHQWLNVAHQGSNGGTRADGVIVLANMSQHGIDVVSVERSSAWKTKVNFLQAQLFHVAQEFDLLFNGWIASTWTLKAIAQRFIIKPYTVRVVGFVSLEVVLNRVPIVNQRTLVHQSHRWGEDPQHA